MTPISIFIDGSCYARDPLKRGGYGVFIENGCGVGKDMTISRGFWNTTVSRMEMKALLEAIRLVSVDEKTNVHVYSDSQFVVNSIKMGYLSKWRTADYIGVKNDDIWRKIVYELDLRRKMSFGITWTPGHQKDLTNPIVYGNSCADVLADYKSHKEYEQDLPLKNKSWLLSREDSSIFIGKTDEWQPQIMLGEVIPIGDCSYASNSELHGKLKDTKYEKVYCEGVLKVVLTVDNTNW